MHTIENINLMINLNKKDLTEENLFKFITEFDVFDYYIKDFELHTVFNSPLRTDRSPSFTVFKSDEHNKLFYKDFGTGDSGDCIAFIRRLLGLGYVQALQQVVRDFSLQNEFIDNIPKGTIITGFSPNTFIKGIATEDIKAKQRSFIQILPRLWKKYDLQFWANFGISQPTLKKFWIQPLTYFFINGHIFTADKYCYAYIELKDESITYKIYQPYSKDRKWISNHPKGAHQGYRLLPKKSNILIITKSLKDVMSLYEVMAVASIAIQNERIVIKDTVMEEYMKRFKRIIGFFDNDSTGKELSEVYVDKYGIECICSPFEDSKDFSDIVKNKGKEQAETTFLQLINPN